TRADPRAPFGVGARDPLPSARGPAEELVGAAAGDPRRLAPRPVHSRYSPAHGCASAAGTNRRLRLRPRRFDRGRGAPLALVQSLTLHGSAPLRISVLSL